MSGRTIRVDALARVEGEGGLTVRVRDDKVIETKLDIFEPPRFFEAFLRGRHYREVPDIVARICGICPVAHQLTACQAIENAFGAAIPDNIRELRRLLVCGEWIESHVLHIGFLHAPDFLGYEDAIHMAATHPNVLELALKVKKIGNEIVRVVGGREVHPVNLRVGGFFKFPAKMEVRALTDQLKWGRDAALEILHWTATLEMPDFDRDYEFVSLSHPDTYALIEGSIVSSHGLNIGVDAYEQRFVEDQVPHSNALYSLRDGQSAYFCGPIARFHHNGSQLTADCQAEAAAAGLTTDIHNPFKSIIVRAVETLYTFEEALQIVEHYDPTGEPFVDVSPRIATGRACTEAPRGLLFHRYSIDDQELVKDARIVPPTAQSLRVMEEDLRLYVERNLSLPREELTWRCEQVIRNYDPCISCATHCLTLNIIQE